MITNIFEICQKVNFKLNLLELLMGLTILVLIKVVVLLVRRFVNTIRNDSIIDERVRERRSRIARVAAEIDYTAISESESESELDSKFNGKRTQIVQTSREPSVKIDETSGVQTTVETQEQIVDNSKQALKEEQISSNQEVSAEGPTKKKTRAMSMEERWADFDKKRAKRNSA
ncbi:hypothetical protein [Desulfosporosinus metallidurans]|uniref:Uncharacterized protein n=1 Tax=Desulfosporosinus metallidurans TaxID=1888891 RepID=A0A1Q8QWC9_9FIRM|nr:hypothetical protein [Desulfosporosinus metallidurans]OLN31659.1 hypothetical protein DSOL_2347 [Desulfosporosinus metallidurans]